MSKTHWKKLTNPNYLGTYAFNPGEDLIATIKSVAREVVTDPTGKKEECTVMHFKEDIKPMILNSTNSKTITSLFYSPYIEDWEGKRIQIYVDNRVKFGRDIVEGLRIRKFIPKEIVPDENGKIKCEVCGQAIEGYKNTNPVAVAKHTQVKYGKMLCSKCAIKAKEIGKAEDVL